MEASNNAKLREAVEAIEELSQDAREEMSTAHYPIAEIGMGALDDIRDIAKAALAAPARNCDLPEVAKDPWRAWLDDKSNWDEFGSPELEIHDWLLAPATEKEGGDDGNE